MSMQHYVEVPASLQARISAVVDAATGDRFRSDIRFDEVVERHGRLVLVAAPRNCPDPVFAYYEAIASAEIDLYDAGVRVTLVPDIRQKCLTLASRPAQPMVAYLTQDGDELRDLAAMLGCAEADLEWVRFSGYAYDTVGELDQVLLEARRDHPDADFSRVEAPRAA
ncbi:MAG: hypothetical protein NT029_01025 [Armatimonadetes bacterium]|nr:hypothetical protein [Armatimonadota bacterium]